MKIKNLLIKLFYMNNPIKIAKKIGVQIGSDCRILDDSFSVFGSEPYLISLGNHVSISSGVRFITHNGALWVFRNETTPHLNEYKRISVGNNVFIGMNSIVMPGVIIGDNVIIGANSVVTKNVDSNCVVCGSPARKISSISEYEEKVFSNSLLTKPINSKNKKKRIMEYVNYE